MCHSFSKRYLLFVVFSCSVIFSFAQKSNKENSPYTRFGIGEFRNGTNIALRGMATISSAYSNAYSMNTDNPASYAGLKFTTYEGGMEGSRRTIISNGISSPTGTVTLSYMNIGIPMGKNFGLALGLKPFTRTYYNTRDSITINGLGEAIRDYYGDGSTNYGYIGFAGKIKGFSLGVNIGYLFGTINHSSNLINLYDTANYLNSSFSKYTRLGGIYYKAGLQYEKEINKNLGLRIGGTFALSQNINAKKDEYEITEKRYPSAGVWVRDSSLNNQGVTGSVTLPATYSFGAQLYNNQKWMAGIDISFANWSQYRDFGAVDSVADNAFRIALGGAYTPDPNSIYKYLSRVTYRLGFYYGKDYIHLRNTDLNYYAVTAGASLPFKRSSDRVHIGMEVGKRGTESNGLIRENFFKFSVGISLNDRWFIKRKYD